MLIPKPDDEKEGDTRNPFSFSFYFTIFWGFSSSKDLTFTRWVGMGLLGFPDVCETLQARLSVFLSGYKFFGLWN